MPQYDLSLKSQSAFAPPRPPFTPDGRGTTMGGVKFTPGGQVLTWFPDPSLCGGCGRGNCDPLPCSVSAPKSGGLTAGGGD